jgi:IS5 family transposase
VAALEIKVDTYVLETDVHFPTDLNLLWDAGRKCLDFIGQLQEGEPGGLAGWRKLKDWRRRLKGLERQSGKAAFGGGQNKEARVKRAVTDYLRVARELSVKVGRTLQEVPWGQSNLVQWVGLTHFQEMLDKHIDLVDRRLLQGEVIPVSEKLYSLFEPHTEWITKGKARPAVELGHRLCVATDQHGLAQDYRVLIQEAEVNQSVPVADRLLGRYGAGGIASISFDKGFSREADRQLLELYIPLVVMPKRGKRTEAQAEREGRKKFVALRRKHSAVESDINALEHHGLDRCLDRGLGGYQRYVGYGVLALNLHRIGRRWLERQREEIEEERVMSQAA